MRPSKLQAGDSLTVTAQEPVAAWVKKNPAVPILCNGPDGKPAYVVMGWALVQELLNRYRRHDLPPPPSAN